MIYLIFPSARITSFIHSLADIFKITEREIFNSVAIQNFLCQPSHILHRSTSLSVTISTPKGYLEPRKDLDESSFRMHPALG